MKTTVWLCVFFLYISCLFSVYAEEEPNSSASLTTKAAKGLFDKNWNEVKKNARKCISLYRNHALKMQGGLKDFPAEDVADEYWALNDVAYAYFLLGEMYCSTGQYEMAEKRYTFVIKKLAFAQKYDPGLGGVWRVADACEKKLKEIQSFIEKDMDPKERLQRKLMGKN